PIEDFANRLFRQWGIGGKKSNRGVLILFAMQDRRYRVEVGYGLEGILNDAKVGTLGREAVPQLRVGDFSGAALFLTGRIADVIAADAHVEPPSGLPQARAPAADSADYPPHHSPPPIGLILGGLALLFVLMLFPGGRTLLWLLLAATFSGRGGGYSGGGGGGGFGGFGGGSSGGGGASGEW
ncbi:MAG: TPM domain-containing protein, partial [Acidobacteriaceae bacterium]